MSPSRLDECDWATYVEHRRRRAVRTVLDPASAVLARRSTAETQSLNPTRNDKEPTV